MNIRKVIRIMSIGLEKNWSAIILVELFFAFGFACMWIISKDVLGDVLDTSLLDSNLFIMYMFSMPSMIIFNTVKSKNNKIDKEVEQIVLILPIKKEDLFLGRLINSGLIIFMMIIPYITMYLFTPSVIENIALRGVLTLLSIYLVVWAIIRIISKYNEKYKILSQILGITFIALVVFNYLIGRVGSGAAMLKNLYNSEVFILMGNTYVGIILGILTLVCFYYFNFTYVLRGIKNNRWQIR